MSRKLKDILFTSGIAIGWLDMAISYAFLFFSPPQLIKDWRIALGIGAVIFTATAMLYIYDIRKTYVTTPKLSIDVERVTEDEIHSFYVSKHIYFYVHNKEERPITDCHAVIEWAKLWQEDGREVNFIERDYLKWAEKFAIDENTTIPANDYRRLDIADTAEKGRVKFSTLSERESSPQGLYSQVRIRIDGNYNGFPMKPKIFDGYLFIEKSQTYQHLESVNVIFREGDWKKDFNIPIRRDVNLN